jgi:cytochrome c oxidase cbb3-type subunit 3
MSQSWSWYVIALVVLNLAGCLWLIWWTARRRPGDPGATDTSHIWDGDLTEYNQPMPRWWINLFYITIAFAVGYLVWYPGFGAFAGSSKWTSAREHDAEKAAQDKKLEIAFAPFAGKPIDVIAQDEKALKLGKSIFSNNCATCHGSSAQGAIGYPNLTDKVWQWGGTPEQILETLLNGRQAAMPGWEGALGGPQGVTEVAVYLQSLSGERVDAGLARAGELKYAGICASCHGVDGKGNQALGSPDLTDDYWMYGDSIAAIKQSIAQGRNGMMPAHAPIIGETRVRLVGAYVWSLSHTPSEVAQASATNDATAANAATTAISDAAQSDIPDPAAVAAETTATEAAQSAAAPPASQ